MIPRLPLIHDGGGGTGSGASALNLYSDHLHAQRPIFLYRVPSVASASARLAAGAWAEGRAVELPPGPALVFDAPGGLRVGVYEPTRLAAVESWTGQRDF